LRHRCAIIWRLQSRQRRTLVAGSCEINGVRQLLEYHPVVAYRFVPDLKARVPHESGGYLVRTNSSGFRCEHEFIAQRRPGLRRALLFGDSFTAGDGVSNQYRFGDQLEQLIPNLEVYNFGISGTGTDQQYLTYQEFAHGIEHDLLIVAVVVENIRRIASKYHPFASDRGCLQMFERPYFELDDERLILRNVPPSREPLNPAMMTAEQKQSAYRLGRYAPLRQAIRALGMQGLAQRLTRYQPVPEYDRPDHPSWRLLSAILRAWIGGHSRPVILVPIPLYQFIEDVSDPSSYQARFAELAQELGCMLHDPLPELMRYSAQERRGFRFHTDVHFTPAGHLALAKSLASIVQRFVGPDSPQSTLRPR
jgi:hypothetical protein